MFRLRGYLLNPELNLWNSHSHVFAQLFLSVFFTRPEESENTDLPFLILAPRDRGDI